MDHAGHQLLANAGLAAQINRHLAARQFFRVLLQFPDRCAFADQHVLRRIAVRLLQCLRVPNQLAQLWQLYRFAEKIESTRLQCPDR